ncbi:MAG: hypothetical protein U5K69_14630 [Balneolaceae bacterium]|nr:hypothetical protein [Balneolaceae bacterium]
MRYRRAQTKDELIERLADLFSQLPNHSVQYADGRIVLQSYDAGSGNTQLWDRSKLKSMSIRRLKELITKKKRMLTAQKFIQLWR